MKIKIIHSICIWDVWLRSLGLSSCITYVYSFINNEIPCLIKSIQSWINITPVSTPAKIKTFGDGEYVQMMEGLLIKVPKSFCRRIRSTHLAHARGVQPRLYQHFVHFSDFGVIIPEVECWMNFVRRTILAPCCKQPMQPSRSHCRNSCSKAAVFSVHCLSYC